MKKTLASLSMLALLGAISGYANAEVRADVAPTQGNTVKGSVTFTPEANGVKVVANISGLTPGAHGFHIHERGDCSAPDATSAGGHFNPTQQPHGKTDDNAHHVGDLPPLEADAAGNATLSVVVQGVALSGDNTIVGRGLIVHAAPDDFTTQPTGNAGGRVACGVVSDK
ncbi:superoxide dismutase [Cu-Zn] [Betaproteobacteria bacterium]|nr:superoxide dismutase [Cu-Zn] [Betaproteobacteria bacterium]